MAFILLLVGLALLLLEFFVSGALCAILGSGAIVASVVCAWLYTGSMIYTLGFFIVAALATYGVVCLGFKEVRARLQLTSDQEGYQAAPIEQKLIGLLGVAKTDLKPSGKVEINKTFYPAVSSQGYLKKGAKIEVIQIQMGHLLVR